MVKTVRIFADNVPVKIVSQFLCDAIFGCFGLFPRTDRQEKPRPTARPTMQRADAFAKRLVVEARRRACGHWRLSEPHGVVAGW